MIETNEMVVTLKDVTVRLGDLGIEYMVTGSFAMSVYTTARTTMDIDIVLEISAADAERFTKKFAGDYYVDASSIRRAHDRQSMFNIINNATLVKVDCIVKKQDQFEADIFSRRQLSKIGDVDFWVISKEDLIISKLKWAKDSHSELQFRDVRNLIETGVNAESISDTVAEQGLGGTWKAFEQWKIQAEK